STLLPYTTLFRSRELLWSTENEINLALSLLQDIKSKGIGNGTLANPTPTFYNVIDDVLSENPVPEYSPHILGQERIGIIGKPNFGYIRTLMVGVDRKSVV